MVRPRLSRRALKRLIRMTPLVGKPARKGRSKVGLPPGTLVYTGPDTDQPSRLSALRYDAETCEFREVEEVSDLSGMRGNGTLWVNLDGVHDTARVAALGELFGIDSLVLEDVVRLGQRPKLETYEGYLFIVVRMFIYEEEQDNVRHEQLGVVLGPDWVLTFQEQSGDIFEPVRQRLRDGIGRIRTWGADYLAYALLDTVVDHVFVVLEQISDRIDDVEAVVIRGAGEDVVTAIHRMKRENLFLRKSAWPLREVVGAMGRVDNGLVSDRLHPFLRDLHDHVVEVVDTMETLRDMLGSLLDVHLSTVSNRMNEVMKVLTIITTIFVPLTFVAGVYGMNFQYMPELHVRWAYPAVLAGMFILFVFMLGVFRRKNWF